MVSAKPWRPESVLILVCGVMIGLGVGLMASQPLRVLLPEGLRWDQQFHDFIVHSISFHGIALLLVTGFLHYHDMNWASFLGPYVPRLGRKLVYAAGIGVMVVPLALGLNRLSLYMLTAAEVMPKLQAPVQILQSSISVERRILFALAAVVFAPIVEETLFRGILYPMIKQEGHPVIALWGTSFLFAAIHLNLMTFIPLTFLAVVLTLLYEETDSLLAPMIAHAVFNLNNFFLLIYEAEVTRWLTRVVATLKNLTS